MRRSTRDVVGVCAGSGADDRRVIPGSDLAAQIADLERRLAELRRQEAEQTNRAFLQTIFLTIGDACFSARDLVEYASIDPRLARALNGWTAKRIGEELRRLLTRDIRGFRLVRVGRYEDGCYWEIRLQEEPCDPSI
jgi:hypothetical protein